MVSRTICHIGGAVVLGWVVLAMLLGGCNGNGALEAENGRAAAPSPAAALRGGEAFLWSRQQADGSWPTEPEGFPGGSTALAVWALLDAGVPADDARLAKAMAWLAALETDQTYTLAVRANAWQTARTGPAEDVLLQRVRDDVTRLVGGSGTGGYTYTLNAPPGGLGDKSNSHYAVLGVEAGEAAGLQIPQRYWQMVLRYWLDAQNDDGGWPYSLQGTASSATMTAAGIATLALAQNRLQSTAADAAIDRGLGWLDTHFAASIEDPAVLYYYFLALQRMGRFVDRQTLGDVEWRPAVRRTLLKRQQPDGHWEGSWGPDISTAYALLVLSRPEPRE